MIVDLDQNKMNQTPQDNPPSYDQVATDHRNNYAGSSYSTQASGLKSRHEPKPVQTEQHMLPPSSPTIYNYVNPMTHQHVASLLPPNHPEMICLQEGRHIQETRYGLLGVLAAVFWFPLGIGLCLLDRRIKCRRCGLTIDDGLF